MKNSPIKQNSLCQHCKNFQVKTCEILQLIGWFYLNPFLFFGWKMYRLGRFFVFNNFWLEITRVRWVKGKTVWEKFFLLLLLFAACGLSIWGLEQLWIVILKAIKIL